jgi:hypothetical protein
LSDISSEACLWNRPQSVNFSTGSERFLVLMWSSTWNIIGRLFESRISETLTYYSLIFWWATISNMSPIPAENWWEIVVLKFQIRLFKSFSPDGFPTAMFQHGCLTFRSSPSMVLFLKPKSLMMSVSL